MKGKDKGLVSGFFPSSISPNEECSLLIRMMGRCGRRESRGEIREKEKDRQGKVDGEKVKGGTLSGGGGAEREMGGVSVGQVV